MFDEILQTMKGYTKEDEFIARDLLLMELLIEKGIITEEEIDKKYAHLTEKIQKVKNDREKIEKEQYDKLKSLKEGK